MRPLGLLGALALLLLAVALTINSGASVSPAAREISGPAEIFTIAQTTTIAGWQIALSLNSIQFDTASACEYSMPAPGTRRVVADVTITPAWPPGFITAPRMFSLVDTGDCRYSLRLPDVGSTSPGLPISSLGDRSRREGVASDRTDASGKNSSLELVADGLWGRIVWDRIENDSPVRVE